MIRLSAGSGNRPFEPSVGESDEWYTPSFVFEAIGLRFALDPCSPGPGHWVPADRVYVKEDDGLSMPWEGRVWMNPPFGGRNGHVPWIRKFIRHGHGIGLSRAYTSSGWFHDLMPSMDFLLFPRGKTRFVKPDGTVGGNPGHGVVLFAKGEDCVRALALSGLGIGFPVSSLVA